MKSSATKGSKGGLPRSGRRRAKSRDRRPPSLKIRAATKKPATVSAVVSKPVGNRGYSPTLQLSASEIIQAIRRGFPVEELDALQNSLKVPIETLAKKIGMSKATLHRRKLQGRLGLEESDRVFRFARLMGKATEVLEDEESARRWLTKPQFGLGGAVPLDYAETEVGAREVEDLLGRIEYGVYS